MRVVTWNAQHGRPNPDGPPDIGRAVAPLRALGADVWSLQELDRGRRRSGRVDQPQLLADGLGGRLLWAPAVHRGGQYGIALVVRGSIERSAVVSLPGAGEPRVVAIAGVEIGGRRWSVAGTHLSTRRAVAERQLLAAIDALDRWPLPRVLLGDLNLTEAEVLPWTSAEGYRLVSGPPTHSTRRPVVARRIDHVLVRGASMEAASVHDLGMSDHRAVSADLRAAEE
jgi:endonuclease/exonuclease/phosphatase family metal-dependent hydrolase